MVAREPGTRMSISKIENWFVKVKPMPVSIHPALLAGVLLCIDDNEDVLECEKSFLESFGYTVLTAPNGAEGLELAAAYPVDVVIVDYFMPEMNGQAVVLEMRRLRPETPIIMVSGDVNIPEQVLRWVDAFVAKDRLSSHLLPAIAQLQERCPLPSHLFDA
jgi:CheY-like chemotaxis protein